ncbi:hypothetical protein CROQUDRAFT_616101 [Cronartium quercuum f. sp. fusiforme G11]|uniref:Uncharacterized protein n=1 Tax=Cronartium quercuum f. sp. fusiforme G11 TaxID=708437 RepID=A0A9P6TBF8_9BASI|nr:hypothetical protein CROQUDRAFT_616101 [Cronartium quercuum f. sp. fusiforme G11]
MGFPKPLETSNTEINFRSFRMGLTVCMKCGIMSQLEKCIVHQTSHIFGGLPNYE